MQNIAPSDPAAALQLHIAVGVIRDRQGRILISKRRAGTPGAGLWEFPGGKCETGETIRDALHRELLEELGIEIGLPRPLIRIRHAYPDRQVLLDTWLVEEWQGKAQGLEGQQIEWVAAEDLPAKPLLPANQPLTNAARLTDQYLITPEPAALLNELEGLNAFMGCLAQAIANGQSLIRLRLPHLSDADYAEVADQAVALCHAAKARLILDRDPDMVIKLGADGLHLSSSRLMSMTERPPGLRWMAASCHGGAELAKAEELGCDFAVLGPVNPTQTHPDSTALGWGLAAEQVERAKLPVYMIGGMTPSDLQSAWHAGAQGIAAIRSLWPSSK